MFKSSVDLKLYLDKLHRQAVNEQEYLTAFNTLKYNSFKTSVLNEYSGSFQDILDTFTNVLLYIKPKIPESK